MYEREEIVTDYFVSFIKKILNVHRSSENRIKTLMYPSLTLVLVKLDNLVTFIFPPHPTLTILKQISEWQHI